MTNQVFIDQIGSYNTIEVVQSGTYHLVDVIIDSNDNNVDVSQLGTKNYAKVSINGTNNNSTTYQSNSGGSVVGHFSETLIVGNYNTTNISQTGDAEKQNFTSINGNNNSISNTQSGTGSKYSDIKATGNGHSITLNQTDAGSHAARIEVTNNGGASYQDLTGNISPTYNGTAFTIRVKSITPAEAIIGPRFNPNSPSNINNATSQMVAFKVLVKTVPTVRARSA